MMSIRFDMMFKTVLTRIAKDIKYLKLLSIGKE